MGLTAAGQKADTCLICAGEAPPQAEKNTIEQLIIGLSY